LTLRLFFLKKNEISSTPERMPFSFAIIAALIFLFLGIAVFAAIILTFSRSAYISLLFSATMLAVLKNKKKWILGIFVVLFLISKRVSPIRLRKTRSLSFMFIPSLFWAVKIQ